MNVLDLLRNTIDYPLRQWLRWRRGGLELRNEPKDGMFGHLAWEQQSQALRTAERLLREYHLQALFQRSTRRNYRENLYYLEFIERALDSMQPSLPPDLRAVDIGPSHWFYVHVLHAALKWWSCAVENCPEGRRVHLSAYEADPYRIYADFHSRYDHAQAHCAGLPDTQYLPQAFSAQPEAFHLATMFFPFIFQHDHLRWGLPLPSFQPLHLLQAAWQSLKPGGVLLIANQGEAEHSLQQKLLAQAGIEISADFRFESSVYSYDLPRYILTAIRNEQAG